MCRVLAVTPSGYYAWRHRPRSARAATDVRVTTDSAHPYPVVGNQLARRFGVRALNRVWAADITAVPTTFGVVLSGRRPGSGVATVVGWATAPTLETTLVVDALRRAIATRPVRRGLIHHSDRGSQYASAAYQQLLAAHGIRPSMSRVGDCWTMPPWKASSAE